MLDECLCNMVSYLNLSSCTSTDVGVDGGNGKPHVLAGHNG
jgi:hypothetical protein